MSIAAARRDLGPQLEASTWVGCTKMAAAAASGTQQHAACIDGATKHRQVLTPATVIYTALTYGPCQQVLTPSPTSTESLIGHTLGDQALSPAGPNRPIYPEFSTPGLHPQDQF